MGSSEGVSVLAMNRDTILNAKKRRIGNKYVSRPSHTFYQHSFPASKTSETVAKNVDLVKEEKPVAESYSEEVKKDNHFGTEDGHKAKEVEKEESKASLRNSVRIVPSSTLENDENHTYVPPRAPHPSPNPPSQPSWHSQRRKSQKGRNKSKGKNEPWKKEESWIHTRKYSGLERKSTIETNASETASTISATSSTSTSSVPNGKKIVSSRLSTIGPGITGGVNGRRITNGTSKPTRFPRPNSTPIAFPDPQSPKTPEPVGPISETTISSKSGKSKEGEKTNGMKDEVEYEEEEEDYKDYRPGGYHPVKIGSKFSSSKYCDQYEVIRKLGWGHFSTVWLCWDYVNKRHVAMKIVKSGQHYSEAALDEIKLLERVNKYQKENAEGYKHVVELYDSFWHHGPNGKHVCMVFEVLGENLLAVIRRHNHKGIPLPQVKQISKQIFQGLDYLHENCGIIHTDLKPENVLVVVDVDYLLKKEQCVKDERERSRDREQDSAVVTNERQVSRKQLPHSRRLRKPVLPTEPLKFPIIDKNYRVKIADLGNACWTNHHFTNDIQTRQYRAPEIIIGARWGTSVDIWSAACLIFELATGDYLFDPKEGRKYSKNDDHLALITELHGFFPKHLAMSGEQSRTLFNKKGELLRIRKLHYLPLQDVLADHYRWDRDKAKRFGEFLMPCLSLNQNQRARARSMMGHGWLGNG